MIGNLNSSQGLGRSIRRDGGRGADDPLRAKGSQFGLL